MESEDNFYATKGSSIDANEKYFFDLQGFLIVEDVLSQEEINLLARGIPRNPEGKIITQSDNMTFSGLLGYQEPLFRTLINHPKIVPYLTYLLAEKNQEVPWENRYYLMDKMGLVLQKGQEGRQLHNWGTPYDAWSGYRVEDGQIFCHLVNVIWTLSDAGEGDGGFTCLPGSHKSKFPLPEGIAEHKWRPGCVVQPPVKAGSAIIFTHALTHGSSGWTADHERIALIYKYAPGHMPLVNPNLKNYAHLLNDEQRQYITP